MARRLAVILALLSVLAGVLPVGGWWGVENEPPAATAGCCGEGCTCCVPESREPACPCRPAREANPSLSIAPAIVQQRGAAMVAARRTEQKRPTGSMATASRTRWCITPVSEAADGRGSVRVQAWHCVWVV
ncbi:MAG: hypothetical protein ACREJO_15085 [Phycisphaerales bacterium]